MRRKVLLSLIVLGLLSPAFTHGLTQRGRVSLVGKDRPIVVEGELVAGNLVLATDQGIAGAPVFTVLEDRHTLSVLIEDATVNVEVNVTHP